MPFVNKKPNSISISPEDYSLETLIRLLDSPDVIREPNIDKTEATVGEVLYFMRTFSGNRVVVESKTKQCVVTCEETANGKEVLPSEITLNDFCLLCGRDIVRSLFPKNTDGKLLAFNAMPTPFGVFYDPQKHYNVAVMQLCMNDKELPELSPVYEYIPVEESTLPDFIKKHFKFTKEDKANGSV